MEDVVEFCERVMGAGAAATQAAQEALADRVSDRVEVLAAASRACRSRELPELTAAPPEPGAGLAESVAAELAAATAALPERQREALALRELAGLSYHQIGAVMGIGDAAVAPLLARARLGLREARRGRPVSSAPECLERDRAVRAMAHRHDGEPYTDSERDWLIDHLSDCQACAQAHAMMLEASLCYRAWQPRTARLEDPLALPDTGRDGEAAQVGEAGEPDSDEPGAPQRVGRRVHARAGQIGFAQAKRSWWQRLGAALAADARR